MKGSIRNSYVGATINHPQTPPESTPNMAFAADNSTLPSLSSLVPPCGTTGKGTVMGYRNFSLAEIGQWQPPQQANTGTMRQQRVVPLHS